MKIRLSMQDRGIQASYWMLKLADALDCGDSLMADAAHDRLLALGFEVAPVRTRRRRRS